MSNEPVAAYRPGETFICTRRQFDPTAPDGISAPCGTKVRMHGYRWCAQVCPGCLANYRLGSGTDYVNVYPDYAAFYDAKGRAAVEENIRRNGGQYVPEFERR